MDPFYFDRPRMLSLAEQRKDEFQAADPFPHVVIDDFLPAQVVGPVLAEFPEPGAEGWRRRDQPTERKLGLSDEALMGRATCHLLQQFNSQVFMEFLGALTGIAGLIPDPQFVGGGLHQIISGGYLKVHVDFNRHKALGLDRRLNLLLYLNQDWQDSYGGHLEFWDRTMTSCRKKILPVVNRCVIFATTATSFHGHPEPLTCPEGRSRRSMALYYYSNGGSSQEPGHTTLFQARPQEGRLQRTSGRRWAQLLLPPIVYEAARQTRRRPRNRPT